MLLTKWGQDLNKYHPLSEYPRPQFVRDSYLNLNGVWQLSFSKSSVIPNDFEYEITVPFSPECPLSGVNRVLNADEYLIYQRSFDISPDFNKGRVFIRFGAVDQIACVYINKHKVGVHHVFGIHPKAEFGKPFGLSQRRRIIFRLSKSPPIMINKPLHLSIPMIFRPRL